MFQDLTLIFLRHARMIIDWCDQALKDSEMGKGKKQKEKKYVR
jgi:hypothetical protein